MLLALPGEEVQQAGTATASGFCGKSNWVTSVPSDPRGEVALLASFHVTETFGAQKSP